MKFRLVAFGFACGVALTLMTSGLLSQDAAAQQSEQDKWFEGFQKYGMPGEFHKKLDLLAGKWDVVTTIWHEGPDNPPMESRSKMRSELILGGRFLQTRVHGTINVEMGGEVVSYPIESMGIAGYDRFKDKYVSIWMSSSSTGIWYSEGVPDETGNVITYFGTGDEWETGTRNKPYKIVDRMVDENTCVTEMFDILGGPGQNRVFEMTARRITE